MQTLTILLGVMLAVAFALSFVQRRGPGFLAVLALSLFAAGALVSLVLASARFGNRLSAADGYWTVAGNIFVAFSALIAMPALLTGAAAQAASRAAKGRWVIVAAGVGAAVVGWTLGGIVMLYVVWW